MREGRWVAQGVEVRNLVEDLPPVIDEQQRRQDIRTHLGEHHAVEKRAEHHRHRDQQADSRQETADAPQVEALEVDGLGGANLMDERARDDIARDDEEHRHAEQASLHERHMDVVQHHRSDRDGAHAIKTGYIAHLSRGIRHALFPRQSQTKRIVAHRTDKSAPVFISKAGARTGAAIRTAD